MPNGIETREQHFRRIFDIIAQGVISQDARGRVTYANAAALRILGRAPGDLEGRAAADPQWRTIRRDGSECPPDQHPSMAALRTGVPAREELGLYNPADESYRWVDVTAVPFFRPGETEPCEVHTTFDDTPERKRADAERERLVQELEDVMANLKLLRGFIPICASCKKIRNDSGSWQQLEVYVRDHSEAEFSHGLCPGCMTRLYPEFAEGEPQP